MSYYQEYAAERVEDLYDEKESYPLIAASRIMDGASQSTDVPPEHRGALALAAATAFSMYGNFVSAGAVVKRVLNDPSISRLSPALLCTIAPQLLPELLAGASNAREDSFVEVFTGFLKSGDPDSFAQVKQQFRLRLLSASSPLEGSLLRSARLTLEHIGRLALARVVKEHCPSLPNDYLALLLNDGVVILLPPQYRAVVKHGFLATNDNSILALPTSSGKTLLAELCMVKSLADRPGLVCYLAPYVALGEQVAVKLEKRLPHGFKLRRLFGGYKEDHELDPGSYREVIVCTPERLDATLRGGPQLLAHLRSVICDEAHLIANDSRGVKIEGLLTRFRLMQRQTDGFRIVLLSAALSESEYGPLQEWLGVPNALLLTDSWRPTARRLAIWKQQGRLVWYLGNDPIRDLGASNTSVLGQKLLPWPATDFYMPEHLGQRMAQKPGVYTDVAFIAEYALEEFNGPVLCVCGTREDSRGLAFELAKRLPCLEPLPHYIQRVVTAIAEHHPFLRPLSYFLQRGVAYHNASLPHDIRRLLGDAIKAGEIRVVAATTTLAEGVDYPFRTTIIQDWLVWRGDTEELMPVLLFRNIAGRCGRAGVHTEGDTIIFDNPVGDPRFVNPATRPSLLERTYIAPRNLAIASAMERLGPDQEGKGRRAAFGSQFMAAIVENPGDSSLVDTFAAQTLWAWRNPSSPEPQRILEEVRQDLVDTTDGAFAQAASPLKLTPLGVAANRTGFSPESCRRIIKFLNSKVVDLNPVDLCVRLMTEFGELPEQANNELRKMLTKKHQFVINKDDLNTVVLQWLNDTSYEDIFVGLPKVQRSKISPKVQVWIVGQSERTKWDAKFDKFVDFINMVIVGFLPWMMRACGRLSGVVGGWSASIEWQEVAIRLERDELKTASESSAPPEA